MDTTKLDDTVNHLSDRVRPQIEDAKKRLESLNGRVTTFIKDHPAACLFGALALGYVIARAARRQRS